MINDFFVSRNILPHNVLHSLAKPILATALMAVAVWVVKDASLWWAILVGIVVYVVALLLLRGITADERHWLAGIRRDRTKINRG